MFGPGDIARYRRAWDFLSAADRRALDAEAAEGCGLARAILEAVRAQPGRRAFEDARDALRGRAA